MYKEIFGFTEEPFRLTPDPEFFFSSSVHDDAITTLEYAITKRRGLIVLTGEVGTGKTTLIRVLLDKLVDTESALILNPFLSPDEILKAIARDFGIDVDRVSDRGELFDILRNHVINLYRDGKNALIVIDEAQHLSFESLEMIRQISNIEMEDAKLVQVLLSGQAELIKKLNKPEYRQIRQRIAYWIYLKPLNFEDTRNYINYRVHQALKYKRYVFKDAAIKKIYRATRGNPREINQVADLSLMVAASNGRKYVTASDVRKAASEYYRFSSKKRKGFYYFALFVILLVIVIAYVFIWRG